MHNVCLGVVKLLFLLTFDVGVSRIKGIRRQKVTQLSEKLLAVKNPSEFSRRTRIIDFANFKAQEWRNLILFYFPLVISSIQERKNEKQLWLLLAFIVRAYTLPEEHYEDILLKVNLKISKRYSIKNLKVTLEKNTVYIMSTFFIIWIY
jgi:hypothetical protein